MTNHTKTIAYVLTVPAQQGHTREQLADTMTDIVRTTEHAVYLTGSHTDATSGSVRFRAADDATAIDFATYVTEVLHSPALTGATLHSGFGVNKRLIAKS
jgi:hypothetical protein